MHTIVVKYKERNVGQCWNCKNCVGFTTYKTIKGLVTNKCYVLPECKVADLYMTHVNRNPCPYYKKRTEVDDSFEKGKCFLCPFSFSTDYESYDCIIGKSDECPIKVVKRND